jgi:AcrR family transcriptional regulator
MRSSIHPTKERLILTTVELMGGEHPDKVHVDQVLAISGISKGSLYHHFEDFSELIESALIYRFSANVDRNIDAITNLVTSVNNREDFFRGLGQITAMTQGPELAPIRFERVRALGIAGNSDRFRVKLGAEQQRVTDALTDLFREAQSKGWLNGEFDPRAAAVFIQAYTLGKVVDDVTPEPMDHEAWIALIGKVAEKVFG